MLDYEAIVEEAINEADADELIHMLDQMIDDYDPTDPNDMIASARFSDDTGLLREAVRLAISETNEPWQDIATMLDIHPEEET